ncbi:Methyltransferase domain-containing protein [Sphingopyxis flava]|uniref:Methyltransferase domain-containing protein n=1 Tax=Sphingopyxis flava TaxID=1507287 RepID=A0A1T5G9R8_9SPHN|nr:Methyltransferase domain-containing protein [Sphingopyxis flava]
MSTIEKSAVELLAQRIAGDMAGGLGMILVHIGEQTGLFVALAQGSASSQELADRAGLAERYVREWASAMAAAGYILYDPADARFSLSPEQETVFASEGNSYYAPPFSDMLVSIAKDESLVVDAFRTGEGIPWGDHNACLFCSTERLTSQTVLPQLIQKWLPQVHIDLNCEGSVPRIVDIGCGRGKAAIAMAEAFPHASVYGLDLHQPSVERARDAAASAGLSNAHFIAAPAEDTQEKDFDLAVIIDALHDMGDPVAVAAKVRSILKPEGRFLVIEPYAADRLEDNFTLGGRMGYAASTCICTPASLSRPGRAALGAQAGYARLSDVLKRAGFNKIRAIQNEPTNIVIEAVA